MRRTRSAVLVPLALVAVLALASTVRADDFYKGKTINIVVGSTPSGSFDVIARQIARYIGRHIPGNPNAIVQNMPGAGSVTAIRYVDASAPKDGTIIGEFLPGIITQSVVTPDKVNVDFKTLAWVGVASSDFSRICYGYGPNGITSFDELMKKTPKHPFIMGTTGTGASNYINGASLREVFGANIKIIFGFPGASEIRLAAMRGELDGDCSGFSSIPADWIRDGKAHPFVRFAEPVFPGVPDTAVYIGDLAKTPEQKQLLDVLYRADKLGRPFIMSKSVPADRQQLLRRGFDATMKDPAFVADMTKLNETVYPLTGEEAEKLYAGMSEIPAEIVAKARKIYE
jgi:tripartite-type tricarboxylate transporter receptor subunit TctC